MKSIVVCVEYDDFLKITLPINKIHFKKTLVVTSVSDIATQEITLDNECHLFLTDVFYDNGASFNKGAAMEKGFDILGRDGWICIWDADIVMPSWKSIGYFEGNVDCLYGATRRALENPCDYHEGLDWNTAPITGKDNEFPGYFQLFHAIGAGKPPWYASNWRHAGGCDSDFVDRYKPDRFRRLPFQVMHLGPTIDGYSNQFERLGVNWYGRTTPRIDGQLIQEEIRHERECAVKEAKENRKKYGIIKEVM